MRLLFNIPAMILLLALAGSSAPVVAGQQEAPTPHALAGSENKAQPELQAEPAAPPAAAAEAEPESRSLPFQRQEAAPERSNNTGIGLGKIAISLAAVLLLVVVLGWLFKKLTLRLPGSQHIKVICSVPLGQRERLLVIEIQGKQRVIGVTPHSINMLFELETSLPETKLASDFHTQLQSFLKK